MELADYIEVLLKKHDCVVVPDFGGFIANYKSAVVDETKNRITPPSKSVLFNPKLTSNDGLLGHEIAESRAISYPESLQLIQSNVSTWQNELNGGKRIEVGEIGFLFKENGQIVFEQNREANILLNAYGLSGISFVNFAQKEAETAKQITIEKPVEKVPLIVELNSSAPIEKEVAVVAETEEDIIPIHRTRKNGWKYLAVAAAIPFLFYTYWIPMETDFIDTGKIQMADFNPIHNSPVRSYESRIANFEEAQSPEIKSWDELTENLSDNVAVYNYQFDDELYIPIKLDKTATVLPKTEELVSVTTVENETLKYHVIGGCFSVKSNADNFVIDLVEQGYQASVLDLKGGLYRVTAGDYSNRSTAKDKLKDFKNQGFSGWILKK